jgi:hypothetical protein
LRRLLPPLADGDGDDGEREGFIITDDKCIRITAGKCLKRWMRPNRLSKCLKVQGRERNDRFKPAFPAGGRPSQANQRNRHLRDAITAKAGLEVDTGRASTS